MNGAASPPTPGTPARAISAERVWSHCQRQLIALQAILSAIPDQDLPEQHLAWLAASLAAPGEICDDLVVHTTEDIFAATPFPLAQFVATQVQERRGEIEAAIVLLAAEWLRLERLALEAERPVKPVTVDAGAISSA
jgi:hypothetical protein